MKQVGHAGIGLGQSSPGHELPVPNPKDLLPVQALGVGVSA